MRIGGSLSILVAICVLLSMVSVAPPAVSASPKIIYVDDSNEGFEDGTQELRPGTRFWWRPESITST
jgi:hypothetical protein